MIGLLQCHFYKMLDEVSWGYINLTDTDLDKFSQSANFGFIAAVFVNFGIIKGFSAVIRQVVILSQIAKPLDVYNHVGILLTFDIKYTLYASHISCIPKINILFYSSLKSKVNSGSCGWWSVWFTVVFQTFLNTWRQTMLFLSLLNWVIKTIFCYERTYNMHTW